MQFFKYLTVGLVNTLIGYGAFFFLVRYLQVVPEIANALAYVLALIVAFMLNKIYVFKGAAVVSKVIPKFLLAFSLSFVINQFVLIFAYRFLELTSEISQIPAMVSYTLVFYFLNKYFVFSDVRAK